MPLDLERFKSNLADGGARASLFQMNITRDGLNLTKAPFHVRVSEIPGSAITPIVQKFAGREIKFAGQRTYTNLTVTILNDEGFSIRTEMERWMDLINSRIANERARTASIETNYQGTGTVTQFSKTGIALHGFQFVGLFPVNMSPIALDWSNDGAIEEYTVEFAYQYWQPIVGQSFLGIRA